MRVERARSLVALHRWPVTAMGLAAALCAVLIGAKPTHEQSGVQPTPPARRPVPTASSRGGLRPGSDGFEQMMSVGPAAPVEPTPDPAAAIPEPSNVSQSILEQGAAKAHIQHRLAQVPTAGGARPGEPIDRSQPSIARPLQSGILDLGPGTTAAFAYVEPYQEPDAWAYRNYCGPGAATVLLSHWDRSYPAESSIDEMGRDMILNPYMGVSILNMVAPINERLAQISGQDLDWYCYGRAQSLDDFRYMLRTDLVEHGIPLITGLMTGGLPGWGPVDVGHFVAIYGYIRTADGTEYICYADTAAPVSGYYGSNLHVWELHSFWQAVSRNNGQIW
jgi:hypothetical protein